MSVDDLRPLDGAHDGARQIQLARLIHARHLRCFPPQQGAARFATGRRHPLDDRRDHIRVQHRRGDIVEEEKRVRPLHQDIVDAMVHDVIAQRAIAAHGHGHLDLGAHPIGGSDQHGRLHLGQPRGIVQPAKGPDAPQHLRPIGGPYRLTHHLEGAALFVDIHPRGRIGAVVRLRAGVRFLFAVAHANPSIPCRPLSPISWRNIIPGQ